MGFGLLLIIIVAVVMLLDGGATIKRLVSNTDSSGLELVNHPREILDTRLARGEIDVEEYQSLRKTLENMEVNQ
ncbi:MAG: hypothetical protein P1S60_19080 [Anaerolineae bacterium]|nr:hypothetical protein [Anaerolineae bacterium]